MGGTVIMIFKRSNLSVAERIMLERLNAENENLKKEAEKLQANLDYISMMSDIELEDIEDEC
jgi:cell division protein FtsB